MTVTSKKWRVKKINKKRVMNKIHNIILGAITGFMSVFFLLPLCVDEVNLLMLGLFILSATWISLVYYSNYNKDGENVDNYEQWKRHDAAQQKKLDELPLCECCEEPIQDEYGYRIGNELICQECLELNYKEAI